MRPPSSSGKSLTSLTAGEPRRSRLGRTAEPTAWPHGATWTARRVSRRLHEDHRTTGREKLTGGRDLSYSRFK